MPVSDCSFKEECLAYCKAHKIKKMDNEEKRLKRCIKIPDEGIKIINKRGVVSTIYPIFREKDRKHLAPEAKAKLGRYKGFNDMVIFVYRDGETYLSTWDNVLTSLNMANHQIGRFFDLPDFKRKDLVGVILPS